MPLRSCDHASAVYNYKIYVFGGTQPDLNQTHSFLLPPGEFKSVYEYAPETNEWDRKQDMPAGLLTLAAHTIGNKIYIVGSGERQDVPHGVLPRYYYSNILMEYDPANNIWATKTPKPISRGSFMSEAVDGKIYVIGGSGYLNNNPRRH